jgi:hypothetical protein
MAQCNTAGPSDFVVTWTSVSENKEANVIIGEGTPTSKPWSAQSSLGFSMPFSRTGAQDTGDWNGSPGCGGRLTVDVESYLQGGNPLLTPAIAGDEYVVQAWYRDPASAKTTQMTDAAHATVCP